MYVYPIILKGTAKPHEVTHQKQTLSNCLLSISCWSFSQKIFLASTSPKRISMANEDTHGPPMAVTPMDRPHLTQSSLAI